MATDKYSNSASGGSSLSRSTRDTGGINNNNSVRKSGFELLDSPGIIPSDMLDQNDALLLAACNSIGVGAYDNQAVASYLCDRIQSIVLMGKDTLAAPQWREKCIERYGFSLGWVGLESANGRQQLSSLARQRASPLQQPQPTNRTVYIHTTD